MSEDSVIHKLYVIYKGLTDTQKIKVVRYAEEKKTLNDLKAEVEQLRAQYQQSNAQ